ncbi:hypothetical protein [Dickeya fangzhongdai]|uniref:hypothetical protein n=1 Tax=Dickeya fangzhongdai TaxID=1778540 RepID=UPI002B25C53F|nr:hypothetical protein [Dickeya fangzhongdai]WOX99977.1 hypothetical protein OGM22_20640 [Dickeya fangzhongdai]WOY04874.1 hypothetical protein OGM21_01785 [Dickeya fangzhongdai]
MLTLVSLTDGDRDVRKLSIPLLSVLFLLAGCERLTEAPFGVEWNGGPEYLKSLNLPTFNEIPLKDGVVILYVTTPPSESLNTEGAYNFYYNNKKLNKIIFNSYDFTGSDSVEKSKVAYEKIKNILSERYGRPVKIKEKVYNENFAFFPCITNKNCGSWESEYDYKTFFIRVYIGMGERGWSYAEKRLSGRVYVEFTPKIN